MLLPSALQQGRNDGTLGFTVTLRREPQFWQRQLKGWVSPKNSSRGVAKTFSISCGLKKTFQVDSKPETSFDILTRNVEGGLAWSNMPKRQVKTLKTLERMPMPCEPSWRRGVSGSASDAVTLSFVFDMFLTIWNWVKAFNITYHLQGKPCFSLAEWYKPGSTKSAFACRFVVAGAVSEAFPNFADRLATLFDFDGPISKIEDVSTWQF